MRCGCKLAGVTVVAVLALPGAALADVTFQAVDGTGQRLRQPLDADAVTVKVGEKVTWTFAGTTLYHNVKSDAGAWALEQHSGHRRARRATYTFTTPGTYTFFCELHRRR